MVRAGGPVARGRTLLAAALAALTGTLAAVGRPATWRPGNRRCAERSAGQ
jgi:hypothetical protein